LYLYLIDAIHNTIPIIEMPSTILIEDVDRISPFYVVIHPMSH
jgi:hypothetical protein